MGSLSASPLLWGVTPSGKTIVASLGVGPWAVRQPQVCFIHDDVRPGVNRFDRYRRQWRTGGEGQKAAALRSAGAKECQVVFVRTAAPSM